MRILFSFRHRKAVEPFVEVVEQLVTRGHEVIVGTHERDEKVKSLFASTGTALTFVTLPDKRADEWTVPLELARQLRDVAQYLGSPYRKASKLRRRAWERLLKGLAVPASGHAETSADALLALGDEGARRLHAALAALEQLAPPEQLARQMLERLQPDLLLATPLVHFGSTQVEIVKAARARGVPVGMLLFSWDNLSTKGALHVTPDHLFVWNEQQRQEAATLHGMDPARVTVTGAPKFDRFMRLTPRLTRDEIRNALLGTADEYAGRNETTVLYLCSSRLVSEKEVNFLRQWVAAVRTHPTLTDALLVVRPHPDLPLAAGPWLGAERTCQWSSDSGEARIRPLFNDPRTVLLTSDYHGQEMLFDSIFGSDAVVGLNTSAEIEAAIVGRPVLTVRTDHALVDGQSSTLHFHYLTDPVHGFVQVAHSLADHVVQLADAVSASGSDAQRARVAAFIRPAGWQTPASDVLVNAIERTFTATTRLSDRGLVDASAANARVAVPVAPASAEHITLRRELDDDPSAVSIPHLATNQTDAAAVAWLIAELRPGDVVYDLTAGNGTVALQLAVEAGALVVAVEAQLPALAQLWQRAATSIARGRIVPLLLQPDVRGGLSGQRFSSAQPDATRLSGKRSAWRGADSAGSSALVQPVLSVPLEWAISRWKLPPPRAVRAHFAADESELVTAIERLLAEWPVELVLLSGAAARVADASRRLAALGWDAPAGPPQGCLQRPPRAAQRAARAMARLQ